MFVYGVRYGPPFILFHWISSCLGTGCGLFFFSSNRPGILVETGWPWMRMVISGLSMPCPWHACLSFRPAPHCLDLCSSVVSLNRECGSNSFLLIFLRLFRLFCTFTLPSDLYKIAPASPVKMLFGTVMGISLYMWFIRVEIDLYTVLSVYDHNFDVQSGFSSLLMCLSKKFKNFLHNGCVSLLLDSF